jgi:hypothetical protein
MNRIIPTLLTGAALLGFTACGGGGGSVLSGSTGPSGPAGTLSYSPPTLSSSALALVKDAASTPTSLVLDLVYPETPPNTLPAVGVTFSFEVDLSKAAWYIVPGPGNNIDSTVFTGGTSVPVLRAWKSPGLIPIPGVASNEQIQGIASNKGFGNEVADIGSTVAEIDNGTAQVIAKIVLTPVTTGTAGNANLVDSGLGTILDASGTPYAVSVNVGTLILN